MSFTAGCLGSKSDFENAIRNRKRLQYSIALNKPHISVSVLCVVGKILSPESVKYKLPWKISSVLFLKEPLAV